MTRRLRALLASIFLFSLGFTALAQNAQIQGQVSDASGAVIPKVVVRAVDQRTGTERKTETNGSGQYLVPGLDPSLYKVFVQTEGFSTAVSTPITLNIGQNAVLDFKMQVGETSQSVTVDASGLQIDTTSASVSTVVDRQFVANIPLNGRSFQSLMTLAPGVSQVPTYQGVGTGYSGEITVNGQRTEANQFSVDGVSANTGEEGGSNSHGAGFSGSVAGESALGTTQSIASIDDLQEFRATTSTYSAEYGRSPGGQFSFVTRSGTNKYHGLVFDYFRNEALDASNWFNGYTNSPSLPKAAERQEDFGGTLGGPVLIPHLYDHKGKPTFFFFSYEGLRLQTPQASVDQQYPDTDLRNSAPTALQPFLNAFPVPNGADLGNGLALYSSAYSNPASLDSLSIRIDQTFSDKLNIFGRYSHAPSDASTRQNTTNLANVLTRGQNIDTVTLGSTYLFTDRFSNQVRFNYTGNNGQSIWTQDDFGRALPLSINSLNLPPFSLLDIYFGIGQGSDVTVGPSQSSQTQFNLVDTFNASFGKHALRFGLDYKRLETRNHPYSVEEEPEYLELSAIQTNQPDDVLTINNPIQTAPIYTNFSAFGQDEWKVNARLALSIGVRWDVNPAPGDAYGDIPYTLNEISDLGAAVLAPKGTPLWQTTHLNFAPRLGLAYRLGKRTGWETVVRAGAGVFFDPGNEQASIGDSGIGYSVSDDPTNVSFPLTPSEWQLPAPSIAPPYSGNIYAYDPHLKLPYVTQWNLAFEQVLGQNQTFTVNYVGSAGRKMLLSEYAEPGQLGNSNFKKNGLAYVTTNSTNSEYQSLQLKYQRQLSHGLQALSSYTWSHSIDETSTNFATLDVLRGNSDFDIRHNLQAALTYDLPVVSKNSLLRTMFNRWSLAGRFSARTALPVDIEAAAVVAPDGTRQDLRADIVPGVSTYLHGAQYPGGRIINYYAFTTPTKAEQAAGGYGNAPRNFLRAFDALQADAAIQRRFTVTEKANLTFRAEAFNLLNHPNFGTVDNYLPDGAGIGGFGYATNTLNSELGGLNPLYQIGGPRSMQLALRLQF